MNANQHATSFTLRVAAVLAALAVAQCGGTQSPGQPTSMALSGVALNSTVVVAGQTVQGTVRLTTPAESGGASVSLTSSNAAVATVQTPVMVPSGASSVPFTVAGVATGTARITATFNGTGQSPTLTVTGATVALSSVSLSASSVVGGNPVVGTVTLTGAAPPGDVFVSLTAGDPVTVPMSVTVPAGSTSARFTIETRAVGGTTAASITGAYAGSTASAPLSVQPFVAYAATASFGVTGTFVTDTCSFVNGGNGLGCTFDGSTSTAPGTIVAWDWSYTVATTISQTTSGPRLVIPPASCALVPLAPLPAGVASLTMTVRLKIRDSLGNVSAEAISPDVRLLPHGSCGY